MALENSERRLRSRHDHKNVPRDFYQFYLRKHRLVIFSESTNSDCIQAKKIFSSYEIPFESYEIDNGEVTPVARTELIKDTRFDGQPNIFVGNYNIKGQIELNKLEQNKGLFSILDTHKIPYRKNEEEKKK